MKIKTKISTGFGTLTALFLFTGLIGIYGNTALKQSLTYVTGTAWDTADGAMEGTIGIEAEIIGISRTLQRQSPDIAVDALVAEGRATANEALGRMESAGLIDPTTVSKIRKLRDAFSQSSQQVVRAHDSYLGDLQQLENNFFKLQLLMESAEEVGDAQVEELEQNPSRYVSWDNGLAEKWTAADGGMEASIGLLKRIYYFQRLVSGKDMQQSMQGLKESRAFLQESMSELISHPVFQQTDYEFDGRTQSFSQWFEQSLEQHDADFNKAEASYLRYNEALQAYNLASNNLLDSIEEVEVIGDSTVEGEVGSIEAKIAKIDALMIGSLVVGLILALLAAWKITLSVSKPIANASRVAEEIANDNLEVQIDTSANDEIGDLLRTMARMRSNLCDSIERDRQRANESARIKQALDVTSGNIMVADADNNIIYLNHAVSKMFSDAEADIRKDIPSFKASALLGTNIDNFHKNPAHQQGLVKNLSGRLDSGFEVGGRSMKFVANPVFSDNGERLGTVVEWSDQSAMVAIQREIETLVIAARNGDLSQSLSLDGKEGFFRGLSEGMNELVGTIAQVFREIAQVMSGMAEGNLQHKMSGQYAGTFAEVQQNVNSTIESLLDIIGNIRSSTDQITTGAEEISNGNKSLSDRTEQQAANLEETASSMEELTSTVRQNADNARLANELSDSARNTAEEGAQIVQNAITAMQEINASSNKIAEIVGVIDEIAFQTNLLALNASVEAARAGEQGRGFAVVATEVRNLAQRSATSAKEIKDLIMDSVQKVETGSDLVNRSGSALENIMSSVAKVGNIVAEISTASNEQAEGIDQINKTITNLDDLTQQNASLAEETSAASYSMNDYAVNMSRQVEFFNLGANQTATTRKPSTPSPARAAAPAKASSTTKPPQPKLEVVNKPKPAAAAKTVVPSSPKSDDDEWEDF